jgi:hypothetical protein
VTVYSEDFDNTVGPYGFSIVDLFGPDLLPREDVTPPRFARS